ncbi:hypothetical protein BZA77DRAFT_311849 [Pyronema omphalodes]|nr:hypothetical protein BZA77DRAFT_311849 [Pyronema omphalodes]
MHTTFLPSVFLLLVPEFSVLILGAAIGDIGKEIPTAATPTAIPTTATAKICIPENNPCLELRPRCCPGLSCEVVGRRVWAVCVEV